MTAKTHNFKIKNGSLTRTENGQRVVYERGDTLHLTEDSARRYGYDLLERLGESDVNARADKLAAERADLEAQAKLQQDRNADLVKREADLRASLDDIAAREAAMTEREAAMEQRFKDLQDREDVLADLEAKAKADLEAKATQAAKK